MSCCFYLVSNACRLFSTRTCSDFVPYFLSYDLCLPTLFAQANEELAAQLAALTAEKSSNSSLPASAAKSKGHTPKSGKTGGAPKPKSKTKHVQPPSESDENQSENENDGENGLTEEGSDEDTGPSEGAKLGRLRRLCERKPSGRLQVPVHIHEQWKQGGHPRQQLLEMLEHAGFEKGP